MHRTVRGGLIVCVYWRRRFWGVRSGVGAGVPFLVLIESAISKAYGARLGLTASRRYSPLESLNILTDLVLLQKYTFEF
jgi:hypothetical protein